jgi:hypothetical protein
MSLFQFTCVNGGNMIIIKPRFLKRLLRRLLLAAILGPPLLCRQGVLDHLQTQDPELRSPLLIDSRGARL